MKHGHMRQVYLNIPKASHKAIQYISCSELFVMYFKSAGWGNGKLSNPKYLNKNFQQISKSLIYGAHKKIPCAPELSVFGTVGAHEAWSCAFSV